MIVLGIESSCDETAAAVVRDGREVLASVVASQEALHHRYGGVVPELASRRHMEAITPVVAEALRRSGLPLAAVAAVSATQGPGLVGSLLVGFSFAKALAFARGIPCVGVNHLEAHVHALYLAPAPPQFPFVCLLASGGHTGLYHVSSPASMELLGQTRDDAAGEAFDKVAKMLGLGYPGGAVIERLAREGDPGRIRFPRAYLENESFDFSFSGIKTAVGRHLNECRNAPGWRPADVAAGFQAAVVEVLIRKLVRAARDRKARRVALVGGVAANRFLRERLAAEAGREGLETHVPQPDLCGDNAAMVAAAGYHRLAAGLRCGLDADVFSRSQ
ncbi:MAG: tRNA (adenosine(37)-N6)-threonylcarbamoyltransferase complex transferase subunit TsaD [Desulfobacterales bacterium]|jgi:N6-L-threonylcarbamoyladenine synthase|nr:tRNA (adenosine(37)-N6)-threonylcarbamoyltransferase complex transferase subunit TsaD [Desulfobacterales bacterium]